MESSPRLWAVAAYFNPSGFRSRRANYEVFRSRLQVPLVTVELGFSDEFELGEEDADILVQIRDGDLMWQKERLLNLAIERLPTGCEVVAWLDCDVVFADDGWAERAVRALDDAGLVQPFSDLIHLPRGGSVETASSPAVAQTRRSFCYAAHHRQLPDDVFLRPEVTAELGTNCGMAWVGRRDLLERHGLYDAMILGMGDKHIAAAAVGRAEHASRCMDMSPAHAEHYAQWASGFGRDIDGRIGYVDGDLYHLWHGNLADRVYVHRYQDFSSFGFDPDADLERGETGSWRWRRDNPPLRAHIQRYFASRREDAEPASSWADCSAVREPNE